MSNFSVSTLTRGGDPSFLVDSSIKSTYTPIVKHYKEL